MKGHSLSKYEETSSTLKYICPICGEEVRSKRLGLAVHNHYTKEIGNKFAEKGCLVVREGKVLSIPEDWYNPILENIKVVFKARNWKNVVKTWREPDLVIFEDNKLTKVIEILGTAEDYRILAAKVMKINRFLTPQQTIVFNAINYVDRFLNAERKRKLAKIIGFHPTTYKQVDEWYQNRFEKEYGLKFMLWTEEDLKRI
jgi:hypothetical protein